MRRRMLMWTLMSGFLLAASPSSAEAPSFDPEQPFRQAFSSHMLRTLLDHALDALEEHIEITGDLSNANSAGDRNGRVQLKVYPKGKSQSDEHLKAEGWFHISPDAGIQDFHFRLQRPQDSSHRLLQPSDDVL